MAEIKQKIKEYFFVNPSARLRVREIERKLKLPLPSVIRYCKELKKERILSKEEIGSVSLYTSYRSSQEFLLEKKLFNLKLIIQSGVIEFLRQELSNPTIVLFGSFSRGEDIETSDIDLYLETSSKKEINLKRFESVLKRDIQFFRHSSLREVENKNLSNNILNGITLNGFLEVFK